MYDDTQQALSFRSSVPPHASKNLHHIRVVGYLKKHNNALRMKKEGVTQSFMLIAG